MRWNIRRIVAVLVLPSCLAFGCKKGENTQSGTQPTKQEEPSAKALGKPDVTLDAAAWHAEFKKNKKAAAEKYKGKVVEVSGTVHDISDDPYDAVGYIYLKVEGDILGVRCATKDKKPWLSVAVGSKIKVKGIVPEGGISLPGDLFSAEVTDPGPKPAILSAEQLAKDYAADRKATAEKYNERRVNLEGEIIEKGKSEFCEILIKLKGQGDIIVSCCFGGAASTKGLEGAKAGQKLKVFGTLSLFDNPKDKTIHLNTCAFTELK